MLRMVKTVEEFRMPLRHYSDDGAKQPVLGRHGLWLAEQLLPKTTFTATASTATSKWVVAVLAMILPLVTRISRQTQRYPAEEPRLTRLIELAYIGRKV